MTKYLNRVKDLCEFEISFNNRGQYSPGETKTIEPSTVRPPMSSNHYTDSSVQEKFEQDKAALQQNKVEFEKKRVRFENKKKANATKVRELFEFEAVFNMRG
jgi:hypothetical protein